MPGAHCAVAMSVVSGEIRHAVRFMKQPLLAFSDKTISDEPVAQDVHRYLFSVAASNSRAPAHGAPGRRCRSAFPIRPIAPPSAHGASTEVAFSTVIWMVCPLPRCLVTPYNAFPLRLSAIDGPDELCNVTVRPIATTTPESVVTHPAT